MLWLRAHLLSTLLVAFYRKDLYPVLENVLCIPFAAFYFRGYSSAIVHALEVLGKGDEEAGGSAYPKDVLSETL